MIDDVSKSPFLLFTVLGVTGILLGKFLFSFEYALYLTTGFLLIALFLFNIKVGKNVTQVFLLLSVVLVFAAWFNRFSSIFPENHINSFDLSKIKKITGFVSEVKYQADNKNKYVIHLSSLNINNADVNSTGKVLLTTSKIDHKFKYGDVIKISTELTKAKSPRNPGQFDYRAYLESHDIYAISYVNEIDSIQVLENNKGSFFILNLIEPFRLYCINIIESYLSDENRAIMKALLLGEKQDIDKDLLEEFKHVGVVHVLAISGLHVGFIMLFVFAFLSFFRLNFKTKSIVLILFLFLYVVIIDFKAPVVRASLMASLFLLGKIGERKVSIFNIVFAAAFIILLFEPRELFNPGFQFSFAAVVSIIYGYPKLDEMLPLKKIIYEHFSTNWFLSGILKYLWMPFLVSLAAVMGTMPLTLYYYGILPVFALFANIIVIPLIGIIVLMGLFLLITGFLSIFISQGLGNIINHLFQLLKFIILNFNDLPYSHIETSTPDIIFVLLMLLMVYFIFNIRQKKFQIISVGFLLISIILYGKKYKSPFVEVTFLDVGQGDASYIQFPNGNSMLVDGGDASFGWDQGKNTVVPFLKHKKCNRLKYVVASHPHNDHIGGFVEVLQRISVDTLILSHYKFNTKIYKNILKICRQKNIPIRYVSRGDVLYPDSTCRVYVLHPIPEFATPVTLDGAECNNSSVVLKIQYGDNGILLAGDLEHKGEQVVLSYAGFLESEILKVGHHGSKTSSSEYFLDYVQPLVGVVSVAERNKFRHPYPGTINRLHQYSIKDLQTSKEGALVFQVGIKEIKKVNWKNNYF